MAWKWTKERERAAHLLSVGRPQKVVGKAIGAGERTLRDWLAVPEFQARVEELTATYRKAVRSRGIAVVERRVDSLNDRWDRLRRIIRERAKAPEMQDVPGGKTGLLVRTQKGLGAGESFMVVEEFALDAALLKELREHEKQAAQELGQWGVAEPGDNSGADVNDAWKRLESRRAERERDDAPTSEPGDGAG